MKLIIRKPSEKIRLVVISFSLFIALMLFQTTYMRLGTFTAAATLFLIIGTYFLQGKGLQGRLILNRVSVCLLVFLVYSVMLTLIKGMFPNGFVRYIAQIIMCILLNSIELNQREHEYLKKVFSISIAVYAVLIIWSYFDNNSDGAYHQDILLFNTKLDPNFVGIPLVASSVLLLDNILKKKWQKFSIMLYILIVTAIIYTASRGSFLSLLCANVFLLWVHLFNKNINITKRIAYILVFVILIFTLVPVFHSMFPKEWDRITSYGKVADNGRFLLWRRAIESWWNAIVFGNGLGYAFETYGLVSHNTYLQILSELGIVGFALALLILFPIIRKTKKRDAAMYCMLLGVLLQISFLDALDNRCLWIVISWAAMVPKRKESQIGIEEKNDNQDTETFA